MDELLKVYAKKRKDQAGDPFELHPATRNLLQTEVSRLAKRKSTPTPAPKLGFWGDVWLRLVFGGAICGVLVLIAGVSMRTLSKSSVNYRLLKTRANTLLNSLLSPLRFLQLQGWLRIPSRCQVRRYSKASKRAAVMAWLTRT